MNLLVVLIFCVLPVLPLALVWVLIFGKSKSKEEDDPRQKMTRMTFTMSRLIRGPNGSFTRDIRVYDLLK